MRREQAKEQIKTGILCTSYLQPAANHSGNNGYCCPYCGSGSDGAPGHTGALEYYPDTNTFYCHACNKGGDVLDLYQEQNGCSFNEALSALAEAAGITIDSRPTAAQDFEEKPETEPQATQPQDFSEYYTACAKRLTDPAALSYLQGRGISVETATAYRLGFDPAADPAAAPGALTDTGKVHPAPRIIAPCSYDFYIARSIDPNTPAQFKAPNPKGSHTKLFNASALSAQDGRNIIFICEGIFDALSFLEVQQPAIALNGKGNGNLLLQALQEHPQKNKQFIICPDNEADPKKDADTKKKAEELNAALQNKGYKSIVYNVAGSYHDINDAFVLDARTFVYNADTAIKEIQRDELDDFLAAVQTDAYRPHRTGLPFFDNLLSGGIVSQSLLLLVAAPGAGKTTLCQQLAETLAENKTPVIYFNFEMSAEQMLAKAISAKYYKGNGGDMSMLNILQGYNWSDADREGITRTIKQYRQENYPYIKYNPAGVKTDINDVLAYLDAIGAAAQEAGQPAPAAVIDYFHLLTSRDQLDTDELIKQAITGLKQYAIKYDTFVIGIIAANRDSMKNGRYTINSGRDSSNIEYTADYMLSLNYTEIDSGKVKPDDTEGVEQLQTKRLRDMIIRVLKARLTGTQRAEYVSFDARHNIFYGTANEFETVTDAPAFDSTNIVKRI